MSDSFKIGILGGGQLAKMLCDAGQEMGYKTIVLDSSKDSCAKFSADIFLEGSYTDRELLKKMVENSDVITYEFENIPSETIGMLIELGGNIPQGKKPLYISQNRIREKESVNKIGIRTVEYRTVNSREELIKSAEELGYPVILKTASGGYDGKSQWIIKKIEELNNISLEDKEYILEKMIDLKKELSVMVFRNKRKEVVTLPVVENINRGTMLYESIVPAKINESLEREITELAIKIMKELDFIGVLGVEFFMDNKDQLYFNEMAPRPHNSGHYSIDCCDFSQFHLHLKSLGDEELPNPILLRKGLMRNIVGKEIEEYSINKKVDENIKVHIYGKKEWKQGRKMGHITILNERI